MPVVLVSGIRRRVVPEAELQRLRRDLDRAPPRAHNLPRQIDNLANTFLDESGPRLPPPPPPPPRRRTPADMQAEREAFGLLSERREAMEERRLQDASRSADRKAARLQTWRTGTEPFRQVFLTSFRTSEQTDAPSAQAFQKHLTNAIVAAEKEKAVYDIATWYPVFPHHVALPLRDLWKRLHGEAKMMHDLFQMEEKAGGMRLQQALHPELARGSCCTILNNPRFWGGAETVGVTGYPNFGTAPDRITSLAHFDRSDEPHPAARALTGRQILFRIQAQLETRKMLLRPGARNRYDTTSSKTLRITYLSSGVDGDDLQTVFSSDGKAPHIYIDRPRANETPLPGPAKAFIEFEHAHEAAIAHTKRRNMTLEGLSINITRVTPDTNRTTTWSRSVDKQLCRWSLTALEHVKAMLDAYTQQPSTIQEGRLIVIVYNQIKDFCKLHNFHKIAHIETIEEEYDEKVMPDSDEHSSPELRVQLDHLEQQMEIFEEQFGDGILGHEWRMAQRSR